MGLPRYGFLLGGVALLIHFVADKFHSNLPVHIEGHVDKGFEGVRTAFQQNFLDGWEPEGASFAVFVEGHKAVDLWGGYADKQAARTWKKDTITVAFSTTKAVSAVCIAMLADRGRLRYDDLVSKHWPGFAKNGKGNITIEWVMSHTAALPYLDAVITQEMSENHSIMREILENEAPKLAAGKDIAYHALTYGWLLDQIVRYTDEKHRGIAQFLREEISEPLGIDFHIGLNRSEEHRVARVTLPTIAQIIAESWHNPIVALVARNFYYADKNSLWAKAMQHTPWFDVTDKCTVNNPELHAMAQAAATGIGNARSLASLFSLFVRGKLVSEKTLALLGKPAFNGIDHALKCPTVRGHGFFYYPKPGSSQDLIIGHPGHGCQQVMFDTKNNIAFAYMTNGLKAGLTHTCRNYLRLEKALYEALNNSKID